MGGTVSLTRGSTLGEARSPLFLLGRPLQFLVALVVNERLAVIDRGLQDFAEEDAVVAGIEQAVEAAFERRHSTGKERHRVPAFAPGNTLEAVVGARGEAMADLLLLVGKDAETEVGSGAEGRENGRPVVDANQHQRRIKRHRCKRVDGQAVGAALGIEHRGNDDAGGKAATGATEEAGRKMGLRA